MKEETVLGYLKTKFAEEQKSRIEFLADGKANSMEEYKNVAGVIRGLELARKS